ncbi:YwqI/YxiC family protein [Oceanobacillus longus]|uniref:YwqI/YxiC family protein n=1 Tax=Oceanobacillus longus TaxID=930120 RepID=A0ABV8H376_9BACI
MGNEIRVNQSEIEQNLSKIKATTDSLQPAIPTNIGNGNRLDVVAKLNELNHSLEQMVQSYKELLLRNEELTRQSVQGMADADREISSQIKVR